MGEEREGHIEIIKQTQEALATCKAPMQIQASPKLSAMSLTILSWQAELIKSQAQAKVLLKQHAHAEKQRLTAEKVVPCLLL